MCEELTSTTSKDGTIRGASATHVLERMLQVASTGILRLDKYICRREWSIEDVAEVNALYFFLLFERFSETIHQ